MKMTYVQAMKISRSNIEKNFIFLGLLIIQNELKDGTAQTLKSLNEDAHLIIKMATGDNILTTTCVAKSCNLIPADSTVYSREIKDQIINENTKYDKNDSIDEEILTINKAGERNKKIKENDLEQKKIKKLVWKLVENLNELDDEENIYTSPSKNINNSNANSTQQSLSILVPQELEEDDAYSSRKISCQNKK